MRFPFYDPSHLRSKKPGGYERQYLITNPSQMNSSLFHISQYQSWPDSHSFVLHFVDIRGVSERRQQRRKENWDDVPKVQAV
jgi:hypothetical protein